MTFIDFTNLHKTLAFCQIHIKQKHIHTSLKNTKTHTHDSAYQNLQMLVGSCKLQIIDGHLCVELLS